MIVIFYLLFFIFLFIIVLFAFPYFSPIPYFPTNKKDLPLIIKALNLKNKQIIFDLGAGIGTVIFEAAKIAYKRKSNTKFIAVEINPILILIMYIKRFFHPNKKNIKIVYDDVFKINIRKFLTFDFKLLTFYLYISPWYLEKTVSNIKNQISKFNIVSYMYPIASLKNTEKIIKGKKHDIFVYNQSFEQTK